MAYNDDAVLARLSSLNESHDSIATAAQWIMFHRRHADRTVQLWMQRLKDSTSSRRLSLIYLANEVAQQSRIRHKEDFIIAFSPVIAEAAATAYKGAPSEVQGKLRRVVDVWKDRSIFEAPIQGAIEARLEELNKARGNNKPGFSGSIFSSTPSVPAEFTPLVSAHQQLERKKEPADSAVSKASQEFETQMDASSSPPSAPVYAARLNGLLKTLATAESALASCVTAREVLVSTLEKVLEKNQTALKLEKSAATELIRRKAETEARKQEVEVAIMRTLGPAENADGSAEPLSTTLTGEPDRPVMEALTPPSVDEPEPVDDTTLTPTREQDASRTTVVKGQSALSSHSVPIALNGSNKRRRVDDSEEIPGLGDDGEIDAEVAQLLREEQ